MLINPNLSQHNCPNKLYEKLEFYIRKSEQNDELELTDMKIENIQNGKIFTSGKAGGLKKILQKKRYSCTPNTWKGISWCKKRTKMNKNKTVEKCKQAKKK